MVSLRPLLTAVASVAVAATLSSCGASLPEQNEATATDANRSLETLAAADEISLKKDAMSIGDHWSVKVDGEEIATIEGLDLPTLGDTYVLLSPDGGFMAGEDEDIMALAKTANFYDQDQEPVGELTKEIFSFGAKYNLKDTDGVEIASLNQRFGLTFKAEVEDGDGVVAWELSSAALSMASNLTLTRTDAGANVATTDAILMAVVASEINDAEGDDSK